MRERSFLALLFCVVFGGAILYMGGLSFDPVKDERQFWVQTRFFAEHWPPTIEQIRTYPEPMTPLSFLIWAALESSLEPGIGGGRLVNIAASLTILGVIGFRRRDAGREAHRRAALAAVGLLLFPYYVPVSILLYTDVLAALFVLLSILSYRNERPGWSAFFGVLAIATRQYMVTFPAALFAFECLSWRRTGVFRWKQALLQLAAAATLLFWFFFFQGFGPAAGLQKWPRHAQSLSFAPSYGLYFLCCIGAYFVLPEFALFRRWRQLRLPIPRKEWWLTGAILALFAFFAPDFPDLQAGMLNRLMHSILGEGTIGGFVRLLFLFLLAWSTCLRFSRPDLTLFVVASNAILMTLLWIPWEKYCLPVLASLWYLEAVAGCAEESPGSSPPAPAS